MRLVILLLSYKFDSGVRDWCKEVAPNSSSSMMRSASLRISEPFLLPLEDLWSRTARSDSSSLLSFFDDLFEMLLSAKMFEDEGLLLVIFRSLVLSSIPSLAV